MRVHGKGWVFVAAMVLVVGLTTTALAIEAFQERFEWGDMSKPTTLTGRVIILDPYDEAVWINTAVLGGNAESGYYWQKMQPGKNLKFYAADKKVWEELKSMGRLHAGPAAARVITSVKKLPEIAGDPAKPRSIRALMTKECQQAKSDFDKACYEAKRQLNTSPKGRDATLMQYDVLLPGGKVAASGLTPWSANEDTIGK